MTITAKDHTAIIQAVQANRAVLRKSLPTFLKIGSPTPMLKILGALPGISAAAKRAIKNVQQAVNKKPMKPRRLTPGERRYVDSIRTLLKTDKSVDGRIKLLTGQLKKAPPKSNAAVGLQTAIDILRDGKGAIYPPQPAGTKSVAEDDDGVEGDTAGEDVEGAVTGAIFDGGIFGAILGAIVASTIGSVADTGSGDGSPPGDYPTGAGSGAEGGEAA